MSFMCMVFYRDPTMSRLSCSFCFPRLRMQHQEVMPKSCLINSVSPQLNANTYKNYIYPKHK